MNMDPYRHYTAAARRAVRALCSAVREHGAPRYFWTDVAHDAGAVEQKPGEPFVWYLGTEGTYFQWAPGCSLIAVDPASVREACGPGRWFRFDGAVLHDVPSHVALHVSRGHICYADDGSGSLVEWFERDGEVYSAPAFRPVQPDGYRHGDWQSGRTHFDRYRSIILGERASA